MKKELKINLGLLLALFVSSLALYWPALSGGPLVDDFRLLEASKNGGWLDNFSATPPGIAGVFWRPVVSIFLKFEWLLFHLNFGGYRAMSALLCAITALAIYGVVFKTTGVRWTGIVSAIFFIAWPSHPETMLWIAGQTDGLATCFAWLSIWAFVCYWRAPETKWQQAIGWIVLLVLALLAKEAVIVLPLLICLFAIVVRPESLRNRRKQLLFLGTLAVVFTVGYLWLRGQMIHQPMLGGGYRGGSRRGLLEGVYDGFRTYHLNLGLLNAYAPLSNRLIEPLRWSPDAFVMMLATFGVAFVLRRLPYRRISNRWLLACFALFLIVTALQIFGNYPLAFFMSLSEIPMGFVALIILLLLIVALIFRNRQPLRKQWSTFANWATTKPYVFLFAEVVALFVVYREVVAGSPHEMPFLFLLAFWSVAFVTRPNVDTEEAGRLSKTSLLMAAASIVALMPVLMIRQVDANLANARFAYLATTFSVPALVTGLWSIVRLPNLRLILSAAIGVALIVAVMPVIRVWRHSELLSSNLQKAIRESKAKKVYVLVSPGFIPSATTVLLGGDALDASGRLFRNDGLTVLPGYYADGFTEGDHLQVDAVGHDTWRITVLAGACKNRSGTLSLLPCYADGQISPAYRSVGGKNGTRFKDIKIADPEGEVIAVDENGVMILRRK